MQTALDERAIRQREKKWFFLGILMGLNIANYAVIAIVVVKYGLLAE